MTAEDDLEARTKQLVDQMSTGQMMRLPPVAEMPSPCDDPKNANPDCGSHNPKTEPPPTATQTAQSGQLPGVNQVGGQVQVNFANILANAFDRALLSDEAYIVLKQRENGSDPTTLLASVESDASNDRERFSSAQIATQRLRECRSTQILAARTIVGISDAQRQDKLREQQVKLDQDDRLTAIVFGDYAKQAAIYSDASAKIGGSRPTGGPRQVKAPPMPEVQKFSDQLNAAQAADRKQSEVLHEMIEDKLNALSKISSAQMKPLITSDKFQ